MNRLNVKAAVVIILLSAALAGCTTYSQPRYGGSGVYYDRAHHPAPARVHVDPLVYPYWSLDYFYFSRHYHPYSIVVHRYDPWFYPYPGWYYGYRPPVRSHVGIGYRHYYPWHGRSVHYHHYRPWHTGMSFNYWHTSTPRHHYSSRERVRQENLRIQQLRYRQAQAARTPVQRRGPQPAVAPRIPASSRPHAGRVQQRQVPPSRAQSTRPRTGTSDMRVSPAVEFRHERREFEPEPPQVYRPASPRALPESSAPRDGNRSQTPARPPAIQLPEPRTQQSTAPPRSREPAPQPRSRPERRTRRSEPPPSRSSAPRARDSAPARAGRTGERRRQREH